MSLSFPLFGRPKATGPIDWLLVGLGNPGKKHETSRHNAGFHVIDRLAAAEGLRFDETRNQALLARGRIADQGVLLAKPQTYMNLSGKAVGGVARFYKIPTTCILVIYDDLDLPLAKFRLRLKGGSGGHKGMTHIIQHLASKDFPRVRIGIGRPSGLMPVEAYVLQKFTPDEWAQMDQTYQRAVEAIQTVLANGPEYAMNHFN